MNEPSFRIFMSHRQKDAGLADVLSNEIQGWGIPEKHIFNRSTTPGSDIQDEILQALKETDLFILVYSQPNEDWWWCSFELGAATSSDTKPTTTVVFHCGERLSKGAAGAAAQIDIRNKEDILKFTMEFHKDPDFIIPDEITRGTFIQQLEGLRDTSDAIIEQRAVRLYDELQKHIPEAHEREVHRWDYMLLSLNRDAVEEIRKGDGRQARPYREHFDTIIEQVEIRSGTQNSSLRKFGYQDFEEGIYLSDLIRNWEDGYREALNTDPRSLDWIDDLCSDIVRAIRNISATRTFNFFQSVAPVDTDGNHPPIYYRPAVIRVRRLVDRGMNLMYTCIESTTLK